MNVLVQSVSTQAGVSCFETVRETWKLGNVSTLVSWFILDLDLCDSQLLGKHVRGHNSVGPSVVSTLQAAGPYMNNREKTRTEGDTATVTVCSEPLSSQDHGRLA